MKKVDLNQGTPEWHDWRRKIIGSSDIAAIMGESPYMTKRELYYEKKNCWPKGLKKKGNDFVFFKGHAFEAKAREEYSKYTTANFIPICFESDCGRFGASLDGYYEEESRGVEMKYMGEKDLKELLDTGRFNNHYYYQIQWQIAIANLSSTDLVAGNFDRMIVQNVERDEEWCSLLLEKAEEFCKMLDNNEIPPYTKDDIVDIEGEDFEKDELFELKEELVMLGMRCKQLEEQIASKIKYLTERCNTNYARFGRCKLTKIWRKGAVDYSKISNVDFENYRKPDSFYWKLDVTKD